MRVAGALLLGCLACSGAADRNAAEPAPSSSSDVVTVSTEAPAASASSAVMQAPKLLPSQQTGLIKALTGMGATEVELGRLLSDNSGVKRCYRQAMGNRSKAIEVKVTVGVTLDEGGKLSHTSLIRSSLPDDEQFEACLMGEVQSELLDYKGRPSVEIMHQYRFTPADMQP